MTAYEGEAGEIELSVVMPCLNEVRTLGTCIGKAQACLTRLGVAGEIIVADNGSSDGSQALAASLGARVIAVPRRGYGAALRAAFEAAHGRYLTTAPLLNVWRNDVFGNLDRSWRCASPFPRPPPSRWGSRCRLRRCS